MQPLVDTRVLFLLPHQVRTHILAAEHLDAELPRLAWNKHSFLQNLILGGELEPLPPELWFSSSSESPSSCIVVLVICWEPSFEPIPVVCDVDRIVDLQLFEPA